MSGEVNIDDQKIQITVFKNERKKEGSNQPDYQILKSEPYNPKKEKAEAIEQNNEIDDPNAEAQITAEEAKK